MSSIPIRKPGYSQDHDSWFIPLTQGVVALVDAAMVPELAQHNWHLFEMGSRFYAVRNSALKFGKRRKILMHRIITEAPHDLCVDHIIHHPVDHRLIDNRKSNLRVCTQSQNVRNRRPNPGCTSEFKGVHWENRDKRWIAKISRNNKTKVLGSFRCEIDAARAYDAAALKYFGEFALTNERAGVYQATATARG